MEVIVGLLIIIGACAVAGFVTRGTDDNKDRDSFALTLLRGFGVLTMLFSALGLVGGIIYGLISLFS